MTRKTETKKLTPWPPGKPIPNFGSHAEEESFWLSHDFDDAMDGTTDQLVYEPQVTRRPRTHVYRVRLDDEEMATLQNLAKNRGVTASVILRELVRMPPRALQPRTMVFGTKTRSSKASRPAGVRKTR